MGDAFDGLARAVGDGVAGLVGGAFQAIGAAFRGVFAALQGVLPGLWLPIVVVAVLIVVGWQLAKR